MKAHEKEREINIRILDNSAVESTEKFHLILCDESTRKQFHGEDTKCTITILDNDTAGTIGFADEVFYARPEQRNV